MLLIKGSVPPSELAGLETLLSRGLAESTDEGARLTVSGKAAADALFAADADSLGETRGLELLEQFHALDERMKQIITAWQIREVDGAQVLNDHADKTYDAKVLRDLAALNADAAAWLGPLAEVGPRFLTYRERLTRAAEAALTDVRYVASPRVDSYHTVWFEMHEDLLCTLGLERGSEDEG